MICAWEQERELLALRRRGLVGSEADQVQATVTLNQVEQARMDVDSTLVSNELCAYVASIVRSTRSLPAIALGASPRAGVHLLTASKARARLSGREYVSPDDVVDMAVPVLAHRLVLKPEAELARYRPADLIRSAVAAVAVPR